MKETKISEIVESVMQELESDLPGGADWQRIRDKVREVASQMNSVPPNEEEEWRWQPDPEGSPEYDSRGGS